MLRFLNLISGIPAFALRLLVVNLLAFMVALVFSLIALAAYEIGHAATPTEADIERARNATASTLEEASKAGRDPQARRAMGEKSRSAMERTETTAQALRDGGHAAAPRITDEMMEKARRDVSDLLSRVRNDPNVPATGRKDQGDLTPLIMISFSMPADSIKGLFREAERIGARVILRGMVDDSMQATAAHLMALMGVDPQADEQEVKRQVAEAIQPAIAIDPTLFQRFDITKVPTFVVPLAAPAPCSDQSCPAPPYLKVAGDVSLTYALRAIESRSTDRGLRDRLKGWINMLEETNHDG